MASGRDAASERQGPNELVTQLGKHACKQSGCFMSKAGAISETPAFPRSSGTAAEEVPMRPKTASAEQAARQESPATKPGSIAESLRGRTRKNGRRPFASLDEWPRDLDTFLIEFLAGDRGDERGAIACIRRSHPQFSEDLIWLRIVYLGLTDRERPPYRKHQWTADEDGILRSDYGRSRASTQAAIEKILAMHPDWSRDAVVWRARALGLSQHRDRPHRVWTPALDHLLLSLQGCQPETIAKRLGCTKPSALGRLRRLGRGAEFFGGFKTKDLIRELRLPETAIQRWVRLGWLRRKRGRITDDSLRWLCRHHPEEIPFETLAPETRNWLKLSLGYGGAARVQSSGPKKS